MDTFSPYTPDQKLTAMVAQIDLGFDPDEVITVSGQKRVRGDEVVWEQCAITGPRWVISLLRVRK